MDGRKTVFADTPVECIGWAPVAQARRVPVGAVMQIMVQGSGVIRIPAPGLSSSVSLIAEGKAPGSRGEDVPCMLKNGELVFRATSALSGKWLYAVQGKEGR